MDESFELKSIKKEDKTPNWYLEITLTTRTHIQMAYQFTTTPISPNSYISCTINNINPIVILNNKKKDWIKKCHKIIWGIQTIANIQPQLQNVIKLADVANMQLAEIKTTILQASNIYRTQIAGNIFSISDLWDIIQENMENQVYYIQTLLADELDKYRGKGIYYANNYIKEIQDAYKIEQPDEEQPMVVDKGK